MYIVYIYILFHSFHWVSCPLPPRFITDVNTVDGCITNMVGVISGAIFYLVGHTFFLALANPLCLALVPPVAVACERVAGRRNRRTAQNIGPVHSAA